MSIDPGLRDGWSRVLEPMRQLRGSWPSRGWSWDGRLLCVASSFDGQLDGAARAAAALALPAEWQSATIQRAPAPVREVADRTGGLRAGQMLLVSEGGAPFAYGLWWPWGDGMTTSLRIGLGGAEPSERALARLRDVFGVEL